ncbi:MAG: SCP2 sterol-binding domain-containing protein [Ignavibacteriae bacterium]|nr:SCP2 sterol-binding domain-containing protein [Ignavibacteriota bacterium]
MKIIFLLFVFIVTQPSSLYGQARSNPKEVGTQAATKSDTADQPDPKLAATYKGLFDKAWSQKFVELWNSNPDTAKVFSGMGKVHFVSIGIETIDVFMNYDSAGKATVLGVANSFPTDTLPTFSAELASWAEFMEGKFGAVKGVMTGKIKFRGNWAVAFKYGFKFDKVAPVGKRATEIVNQKKK